MSRTSRRSFLRSSMGAASGLGIAGAAAGEHEEAHYGLVIRNARIYDGERSRPRKGAIAVRDGRIAAVGRAPGKGTREIDADGMVACPGFIDLHTHCDNVVASQTMRPNTNYLTQGVTTVVTGNCGTGRADVAKFLADCDKGIGTNVAHLVPHGRIRAGGKSPTPRQMATMKARVRRGMECGAWGMSTGLWYTWGQDASTDECVELSKVVAACGGIYTTHMRDEGEHVMASIAETIEIGERAGCPVHISHFKLASPAMWGKASQACALVEAARKRGLRVTADQYPYNASMTSTISYVFPGMHKATVRKMMEAEAGRQKLLALSAKGIADRGGPDRLLIRSCGKLNKQCAGKSLAEAAKALGKSPAETAMLCAAEGGGCISRCMRDDDVELIMAKPYVATSSDGWTATGGLPHPRCFGSFPRKLGHYVRQKRTIGLAHAIRAATSLPASIVGFADRGVLRPGAWADVVVFDPDTVLDKATFAKPCQRSVGIHTVLVNGQLALADGKPTGLLAGNALRNPRALAAKARKDATAPKS